MELKICHLYPDVLFGDRGNVLCLQQRLLWRGIDCTVTEVPIGTQAELSDFDLFFLGGAEDFEQNALLEDLSGKKAEDIRTAVEAGKVFLAVGSGMQLMGKYRVRGGEKTALIGAVDLYTELAAERLTGNFAFSCEAVDGGTVVGFENHAGRTYLGEGLSPLGKVLAGHGNNGEDGTEGFRYKNLFGSYCHGPLLPKNPLLADAILLTALQRKYPEAVLSPLDDRFENEAHDVMVKRLCPTR